MASNTDTGQETQGDAGAGPSSWETDFRWLVAWLVLLLLVAGLSKTRVGAVIIYYGLALMLLFLVVTQFRFFAGALAPFNNLGPGLVNAGPQGG